MNHPNLDCMKTKSTFFSLLVQSADMTIKCYTGTVLFSGGHEQKVLQEETCESGVTQCLKSKGGLNVNNAKGKTYQNLI